MTARDTSDDAYMMRPKRGARVTYYKDRKGKWQWRLQAANWEIVGQHNQGYDTLGKARKGYMAMFNAVMTAREVVICDPIDPPRKDERPSPPRRTAKKAKR